MKTEDKTTAKYQVISDHHALVVVSYAWSEEDADAQADAERQRLSAENAGCSCPRGHSESVEIRKRGNFIPDDFDFDEH